MQSARNVENSSTMNIPTEWLFGLLGGGLIGLGSITALAVTGKVPGISGIVARLLTSRRKDDIRWRVIFLCGLVAGAVITFLSVPSAAVFRIEDGRSLPLYAVAGLFVGIGTRLGGGCTSGHGVCGIGAGARDSIIATLTFMSTGIATAIICTTILSRQ